MTKTAEELTTELQAPIADEFLSWKPSTPYQKGGDWYCAYFPYINKEFLEERLDRVLGLSGWDCEYAQTAEDITVCRLSLNLPLGARVTREGTGAHRSKSKDETEKEADEIHGGRTRAFRDACRVFGICGRDIVNTQTCPVKVIPGAVVDGKAKFISPAEPLNRSLLIHSGAASTTATSGNHGVVKTSPESRTIRNPQQAANQTEIEIAAGDAPDVPFPYGKKHNGQALSTIPSAYLRWACENMDYLNPNHEKFNSALHAAICVVLDEKAKAKEEKESSKQNPMDTSLEELFGGEEES